MRADPIGAVHHLAKIGSILALSADAAANVGTPASASAGEKHESVAAGATGTGEPGVEAGERGRVEGGGVGDGVLLPRGGAGLEGENGEVEELGAGEEGGAPEDRVSVRGLGEVPGGTSKNEEVVVAVAARVDVGLVREEVVMEGKSVKSGGVEQGRGVEEREGVEGGIVGEVDGVGEEGVGGEARVLEKTPVNQWLQ